MSGNRRDFLKYLSVLGASVPFLNGRGVVKTDVGEISQFEQGTVKKDQIDQLMESFVPGSLSIIAARPSVGKTGLMLGMAERASRNKKIIFFSREQSKHLIELRYLRGSSSIPKTVEELRSFKGKPVAQLDYEKAWKLVNVDMVIDDSSLINVEHIERVTEKSFGREGFSICFVDYLQILDGYPVLRKRPALDETLRRLKSIAVKNNIAIVVASQTRCNINSIIRKDFSEAKLVDASYPNEFADNVHFLFREDYYDRELWPGKIMEVHTLSKSNDRFEVSKIPWSSKNGLPS